MRAESSNSPSAKHIPPEHPVTVQEIRPHALVAAGVSVFVWYDPTSHSTTADSATPSRDRPQMERIRRIRFDVDPAVLRRDASDLSKDSQTTVGRLRELATSSEMLYVLPATTALLSRRDHSRQELMQKLKRRGFSSAAAEHAIETLEDRGYQDDRRFAESWLRSAMRRGGRSRGYIAAALSERGVNREIVDEVIADYIEEFPDAFDEAVKTALEAIVRNVARRRDVTLAELTEKQRKSVISRLMRRGFSMKEIQKHFD